MEFLAPAMLLGLAGIAAPIAIHLIGRRKARRVPFAAIDFLLGSDRQIERKLRLRELLLLLARILVCLAIPLVVAKPFTSCETSGPSVTRGPQAAVLVVDNSFVSAYEHNGSSLLATAKAQAYQILKQLGPEAEVAVIATANTESAATELSRDHIRLRDTIGGIDSTASPPRLDGALRRAAQLTASSNHETRTIYLLANVTSAGLSADELPWTADDAPALRVIDPSEGAELANAAITSIEIAPDPDSGVRGIRVMAEVSNFSSSPISDREVSLSIAGKVVARGEVSIGANQSYTKRFTTVLPTTTHTAEISVSISADGLAIDDRRFALAELRKELPILLVNGDPRTVRYDDELFYLSAALRPGDRGDSGAVLTTTTVDGMNTLQLKDYAVVVLANVPPLSSSQAATLEEWVVEGGGLLITSGSNIDPDDYNRHMAKLLVQRLSGTFDLVHGARGAERSGRALRLAKLDTDHPILSSFSANAPGLLEAGFQKVVLLGPTGKVSGRRVIARYDNGTVALVEAEKGAGRIMFLTSSIDRDWNNLAIQPGFVPLMQQTARHLAGVSLSSSSSDKIVGQPLELKVEPGLAKIQIEGPTGKRSVIEGERLQERRRVRFSDTQMPGFYRVHHVAQAADQERTSTYVVNIDASGSNLARGDLTLLAQGEARIDTAPHDAPRRRVELWHAIAAALLGFLLLESFLVWRR